LKSGHSVTPHNRDSGEAQVVRQEAEQSLGQQTPLRNDVPPPPQHPKSPQPQASFSISLFLPTGHHQCNATPQLMGRHRVVVGCLQTKPPTETEETTTRLVRILEKEIELN